MCTIDYNNQTLPDYTMQCVLVLVNGQPADALQTLLLYIVSIVLSIFFIFLLMYIMTLFAKMAR